MSSAVQFWFDFASTYSYPAAMRVESLAAQRRVRLEWRPFLLGPIFSKFGWDDSPFNIYPNKGRYMWRDLERLCDSLQLGFRRPSQFPRHRLLATRVACRFAGEPWIADFIRAVFHANFADDRDIASETVVLDCLDMLPVEPEAVCHEAKSARSKAALRAQTARAEQLGIFGAPTVVVGDELFWGNDRLDDALDWSAHGAPAAE